MAIGIGIGILPYLFYACIYNLTVDSLPGLFSSPDILSLGVGNL